ncbi:uncharacterized protein B0I36DRAFT_323080 [Microdochium trichocladiopsis]|uniref:Ankyrin repeat-containing domain protein n=1 Tax=Microdochium trichocladiopsis TaxID=1682393 RepID=A0A9P8Y694_9PEZI|nr:uncharacterized protein B0I36DRAFT_323080 [Microdochium trichocladiopsis]KAH7031044.1 hypothetical protein B0I36DRAFT_323080 [Microdochium trichocladiopsis]
MPLRGDYQLISPLLCGRRTGMRMWTLLHFAAILGQASLVDNLLEYGAQADCPARVPGLLPTLPAPRNCTGSWEWTPLDLAVLASAIYAKKDLSKSMSAIDTFKKLFKQPHLNKDAVVKAFMVAIWLRVFPIVEVILASESVDVKTTKVNNLPSLWYCALGPREGAVEMIALLLRHGADLEETWQNGCNVLHTAVIHGRFELAIHIAPQMEKSIDKEWEMRSALCYACKSSLDGDASDPPEFRQDFIRKAVDLGAVPTRNKNDVSPINDAASCGLYEVVAQLLAAKVSPLEETNGFIPMTSALIYCRQPTPLVKTLKVLLGADRHIEFAFNALAQFCGDLKRDEAVVLAVLQAFIEAGTRVQPLHCLISTPSPYIRAFETEKYKVCNWLESRGAGTSWQLLFRIVQSQLALRVHRTGSIEFLLDRMSTDDPVLESAHYIQASQFPDSPLLYELLSRWPHLCLNVVDDKSLETCFINVITLPSQGAIPSPSTRRLVMEKLIKCSNINESALFPQLPYMAICHHQWEIFNALVLGDAKIGMLEARYLVQSSYRCNVPPLRMILPFIGQGDRVELLHTACTFPSPLAIHSLLEEGVGVLETSRGGLTPVMTLVDTLVTTLVHAPQKPFWNTFRQLYHSLELLVEYGGVKAAEQSTLRVKLSQPAWQEVFLRCNCRGTASQIADDLFERNGRKSSTAIGKILSDCKSRGRPSVTA